METGVNPEACKIRVKPISSKRGKNSERDDRRRKERRGELVGDS